MVQRTLLRYFLLALLMLVCAQSASADTVTYTFQGDASGSLGGTSFTNAAFTITVTADTSNISDFTLGCSPSPCTILDVPATTATITVDGMTTTITSPIGVFVNQTYDTFGLSRISGSGSGGIGPDLLDMTNPEFATFNLDMSMAAVGPIDLSSLSEFSCNDGCVVTGLGDLTLTNAPSVSLTDAVSTPEPPAVLLVLAALILLAAYSRRAFAKQLR